MTRRFGSAALDLSYIAAGRIGYWERNLKPWDAAAGVLIVKEAGGFVTSIENDDNPVYSGSLVAGNQQVHSDLRKILKRFKPTTVIASEAMQSIFPFGGAMDCRVAMLLAMTIFVIPVNCAYAQSDNSYAPPPMFDDMNSADGSSRGAGWQYCRAEEIPKYATAAIRRSDTAGTGSRRSARFH